MGIAALTRLLGRGYAPRPRVAAGTTREEEAVAGGQVGEWWVPRGSAPVRRLPTVVLVHGGYWRPGYDRHLEDAVAADLSGRGYLVWNVDYRPAGSPWPATLADVAAAYDHLTLGRHADRVGPVAVVGHSAGGHLALWLGSRARLPSGAVGSPLRGPAPALVVAQAPVADLRAASAGRLGGGAVDALLGGPPERVPDRYAVADPVALLPAAPPVVLVHGTRDDVVPLDQSRRYDRAAARAGGRATLRTFDGGHFEHLDPSSRAVSLLHEALGALPRSEG